MKQKNRSTSLEDLPEFITVEELGAVLRVGKTKAYELAGKLHPLRLGRVIRVPRRELERLMGEGTK